MWRRTEFGRCSWFFIWSRLVRRFHTVETDEEPIEGLSFMAYRRVATVIFLPLARGGPGSFETVPVDRRRSKPQSGRTGKAAAECRHISDRRSRWDSRSEPPAQQGQKP
jgi:hypothetical protein